MGNLDPHLKDNTLQQAVHDWLVKEFKDSKLEFRRDNNPLNCYYDDRFMCEVRVDVIAVKVSIWTPIGGTSSGNPSKGFRFSCHPYKTWFLEDPESFDGLRDVLQKLCVIHENFGVDTVLK